jgi:aerobic carbon-monoxide dehydrogenase medium subunit
VVSDRDHNCGRLDRGRNVPRVGSGNGGEIHATVPQRRGGLPVKPPAFDYLRPATVDEALSMLAASGDDVRVLAGGQSLIPLMNFRVALPDRLVDINFIDGLRYIRSDDGELAIGAGVRQAEAERSTDVIRLLPELAQTLQSVAHLPVRNRGTVVGSIAHADPAAELPALLLALDGSVVARSATGERRIGAAELFEGPLVTTLAPGELIVEARFPTGAASGGHALVEYSRRHADFAVAGSVVALRSQNGTPARAAISLFGVQGTPVRAAAAERILADDPAADARAVAEAAVSELTVLGDIHGGPKYRRRVARACVQRALIQARGEQR